MKPATQKQKDALSSILDDIWTSINEGQSDFGYRDVTYTEDSATLNHPKAGKFTIRAVDIIIEES